MAVNRKPPNTAKATVWTKTARSQMEGPTKSIIYYMFMMVPSEDRQQLLTELAEWNANN
ncbi:hypothetical protein HX794_21160 [Pseudomonas costantinii]|uniref:hypothetical protein n=1 Tax=Pseudomonas costantinii TaxID=168469 RepID=UPI00159FA9F0|nr:hypothetical protein [Pseudomonas costantinii]NVZ22154.1 hypothetical protein [Pseudomonas costantinii]